MSSNQSVNSGTSSGLMEKIGFTLVYCIVLYFSFIVIQIVYQYLNKLSINRTVLLDETYMMDDKMITINQNPNMPDSVPVHLSDNEYSGIEFSYSFYINVSQSNFRTEHGLLHIFHKGYSTQFPLLAPGVYLRSDENTLRVYMNTYKTWNNFIEVPNFPIGKWVHVVLICTNNSFEIYVNGNLAKKRSFNGYAPYQNYQNIYCFNQGAFRIDKTKIPSLVTGDYADETDGPILQIFGAAKGMLSHFDYFNYALCYAEIQKLLNEGPSSTMASSQINNNKPPYLSDKWWSHSY